MLIGFLRIRIRSINALLYSETSKLPGSWSFLKLRRHRVISGGWLLGGNGHDDLRVERGSPEAVGMVTLRPRTVSEDERNDAFDAAHGGDDRIGAVGGACARFARLSQRRNVHSAGRVGGDPGCRRCDGPDGR